MIKLIYSSKIKKLKKMKKISFAIMSFIVFNVLPAFSQVQYTIRWETSPQPCYVVYMKSTTAYNTPFSQIPTAQATVVVPHGTGSNKFTISNLVSYESSMQWVQNARVDAPSENPTKDYITFGFQGATSFNIPANTEIKLFSFKNTGTCLGSFQLIDNQNDPFSNLTPPDYANSANTNPGNAITVLGAGGEAYTGNYGTGANACSTPLSINPNVSQSVTSGQSKSGNAATDLSPTGGTAPLIYSNGNNDAACIAPSGANLLPSSSNLSINASTGAYTYTAPTTAGTYYFCIKVCDSSSPTPVCSVSTYTITVTTVPCTNPNCSTAVNVQKN